MKLGLATRAFVLVLTTAGLSVAPGSTHAEAASPLAESGRFVTTWDTSTTKSVELNLYGSVDALIDWGDGSTQRVAGVRSPTASPPVSHTYSDGLPEHEVTVTGTFTRLGSRKFSFPGNLLAVDEWGQTGTTSLAYAFRGSRQLNRIEELPSGVTNMTRMLDHSAYNGPATDWDVSHVTDMSGMFYLSRFNQPIGNWDVSGVTDMSEMFTYSRFDQPIGGWDVSGVTDMSSMFRSSDFNKPIGAWNVSNVTDMDEMFAFARDFNQPIGDWDVSSLMTASCMFCFADAFNQPIGRWDVSSVTDMYSMFLGSAFNRAVGGWDVGNVTNMDHMFSDTPFNRPIGEWDVSRVMFTTFMFANSRFNQPIGDWDVRNVLAINGMFSSARRFNQDLSSWCVRRFPSDPDSFGWGTSTWTLPKPVWGTCPGVPPETGPDVVPPTAMFVRINAHDGVLDIDGAAYDNRGVRNVPIAIRDQETGKWLHPDGSWGAYTLLYARVGYRGETAVSWGITRSLPVGRYGVSIHAVDTSRNRTPKPRPWRVVQVTNQN